MDPPPVRYAKTSDKTGVANRTQASAYARDHGLT
jgi:DNA-binding CsgD family transcriptional regulator